MNMPRLDRKDYMKIHAKFNEDEEELSKKQE